MKYLKILVVIAALVPFVASSQCRSFTKKRCLPMLEGFVQNDNFNSAVLMPGDEAELLITFYENKKYRLMVCSHPILGDVEFEVMDIDYQPLYSNKDKEEKQLFDFETRSTQQLIIKVHVPKDESQAAEMVHNGCVSVMVGSMENE